MTDVFEKKPNFLLETLLIGVFFGLLADGPPPGVNEAHYLTKARHYWDPSFCSGDLFLESADAHLAFYWSFGWVTLLTSFETAAWIGRILAWGLLATGWARLSISLLPNRGMAFLGAVGFVLLQRSTHMAGEWVVGGVEAKCFAYGLVFHALAFLVQRRWLWVWPLLGAATSFHVLVGGWSLVAAAIAFLFDREQRDFGKNALSLLAGAALALVGLLPALRLNAGVSPEVAAEAADIYVYTRLPHHLSLFNRSVEVDKFKEFKIRMGIAVTLWAVMWHWIHLRHDRGPWARLQWFICGSVLIAGVGVAIDLIASPSPLAASVLRFYWYRLADVMVPLGIVLGIVYQLLHVPAKMLRRLFLALASAMVMWMCGQSVLKNWSRPMPQAFYQLRKFVKDEERLHLEFRQWKELCQWLRDKTPEDSRLITPRGQQTIKWYGFRGEVTNWKDVPQDAAEVVRWYDRQRTLYPREVKRKGLSHWSDADLLLLLEKYKAQLLLLDRDKSLRTPDPKHFTRVFPEDADVDSVFEVYRPTETEEGSGSEMGLEANASEQPAPPIERIEDENEGAGGNDAADGTKAGDGSS